MRSTADEPPASSGPRSPIPIMPKRLPWREVAGEDRPRKRENEKDAGDEIEQGGEIGVHRRQPFFLYIASMRSVTRNPPKIFIDARMRAIKPTKRANHRSAIGSAATPDRQERADDDHRGNGVGFGHQRRVQRRCHRPDDVVANEHRHGENREPEHEGINRAARGGVASRSELIAVGLRGLGGLLARRLPLPGVCQSRRQGCPWGPPALKTQQASISA